MFLIVAEQKLNENDIVCRKVNERQTNRVDK